VPTDQILSYYKDQNQVEKSFRFLKSPMSMALAIYLKKPKRIVVLAIVMYLALMVYALAERKLRLPSKLKTRPYPIRKQNPFRSLLCNGFSSALRISRPYINIYTTAQEKTSVYASTLSHYINKFLISSVLDFQKYTLTLLSVGKRLVFPGKLHKFKCFQTG